MKKVLAVSIFAILGVAALSSCKKDYTCECTVTSGSTSVSSTSTLKATKKDAKAACEKGSNTYVVCKIK